MEPWSKTHNFSVLIKVIGINFYFFAIKKVAIRLYAFSKTALGKSGPFRAASTPIIYIGVRFRPALVRYDGFSLLAARDPNIFLSSRFLQG
jgi:hypothetical protein